MLQFQFEFVTSLLLLIILPTFFYFFKTCFTSATSKKKKSSSSPSSSAIKFPRSYPVLGSLFAISANLERMNQWTTELLQNTSENGNIILDLPFGRRILVTTNPAIVQHILKTQFHIYNKGIFVRDTLQNFLGTGIFNADDDNWKSQRQISSHEFNTKSIRKFVETVVEDELSDRLLPLLSSANPNRSLLDLQDILQRFAFDNICKISFGYDPKSLSPSIPQLETKFAVAFEDAIRLSCQRFYSLTWRLKRAFDIGSEKQLRVAISTVRDFATKIVREKKLQLEEENSSPETEDLLSRFLSSGHTDENFVTDMVISFILAGRDTTSAALTWFFWLVSQHSNVEDEILKEIREKPQILDYDDVKNMAYIHASLCETMRLYPPVPSDSKNAAADDVLPDGTIVEKGMIVQYHPYAMGRTESLWGKDWAEFRPERWLEKETSTGKWRFVGRDPYTYPVFNAGPRICLGKDMAFLQMKKLVARVMQRYRVVPASEKGFEPIFISDMASKMKGGFPVRIEER
ncbi:hypothetical protein NE237_009855 [Protea cynaroides]|uniref:Cytochrome P450 n=1 Tax=Protea cynaroides TaxID=273540 RepID=A0A9Q0R0N7_9MAGN|nr:hypothetical protein NE237_009855 [Protea cynaroides]